MSGDWWSRQLAGDSRQRGATPPVRVPAPPPFNPQEMGQRQTVSYDSALDQVTAATTKAQHVKSSSFCPDCGSGNYMKQLGGYCRCFDCGYPLVQSTSGISGTTDPSKPSQPAQQVPNSGSYNPTQIVGRIG